MKNQRQRLFRLNERPQTSVVVWRIEICLSHSLVCECKTSRTECVIDRCSSISNVHPSIQLDYYNTESRRGTRISYFRGILSTAVLSMLCESLQIVFWTVSFVCRIYSRRICTYTYIHIHTHTRTYAHTHTHTDTHIQHSFQICIFIVHMRSIWQRDESRCFSRTREYRLWT